MMAVATAPAGTPLVHITVDGIPEEVDIEVLNALDTALNADTASTGRPRATKPGHLTTSMPANVVDVFTEEGAEIEAGAPLLVIEAMHMESELSAPISGKITAVHIKKGIEMSPARH